MYKKIPISMPEPFSIKLLPDNLYLYQSEAYRRLFGETSVNNCFWSQSYRDRWNVMDFLVPF